VWKISIQSGRYVWWVGKLGSTPDYLSPLMMRCTGVSIDRHRSIARSVNCVCGCMLDLTTPNCRSSLTPSVSSLRSRSRFSRWHRNALLGLVSALCLETCELATNAQFAQDPRNLCHSLPVPIGALTNPEYRSSVVILGSAIVVEFASALLLRDILAPPRTRRWLHQSPSRSDNRSIALVVADELLSFWLPPRASSVPTSPLVEIV
jgi:hypothetical protein